MGLWIVPVVLLVIFAVYFMVHLCINLYVKYRHSTTDNTNDVNAVISDMLRNQKRYNQNPETVKSRRFF